MAWLSFEEFLNEVFETKAYKDPELKEKLQILEKIYGEKKVREIWERFKAKQKKES